MAAYSDEEELEAKAPTNPQEPVGSPYEEQAATEVEDPTQRKEEQEEESFVVSQKLAENTPQEYSPKPQKSHIEKPEQFGNTKEELEVLIYTIVSTFK